MILLRNFKNIFLIPELTKKLLFTLGVIIVYRIGSYIPVIGVNIDMLTQFMKRPESAGSILQYLDVVSAGSLSKCTLFALGIGPYISSSIIMQLMSMTVPYFEQMVKEGDYGYKVLNQYTRYLTFALSVAYSLTYATYLEYAHLVLTPGFAFKALFVLSLTVGSMFVMWLGEQISLMGVGNGSSMLIFAGIVARFPNDVISTIYAVQSGASNIFSALFILLFFVAMTACIVFLEKGERKIPVQYARRVVGRHVYGGQSTYIPFKINTAGVMPVIFTNAIMQLPMYLSRMLADRFEVMKWVYENLFSYTGFFFNALEFGLIFFFTFFYTELVYNPDKLADQMKKNGGFIPGIRPGKNTADFFYFILTRVGLVGALYLGFLAVLPNLVAHLIYMPFFLSGTSILIAVGVALEFGSQVESYLIERSYKGFLTSGRMKNKAVA